MNLHQLLPELPALAVHIHDNLHRLLCRPQQTSWNLPAGHRAVPMTEHYKSSCNECFNAHVRLYDDDD